MEAAKERVFRCHLLRSNLVAFALTLFLSTFIGIAPPADAAEESKDDVVLISHGECRLTVEDVTGVPNEEALSRLARIVKRHGEPQRIVGGSMRPAMCRWYPEKQPRLRDWYHHALSGAAELYVHSCVFDRFVERHPDALRQVGIDRSEIDAYVSAVAQRENAIFQAVAEWLDEGQAVAKVERELSTKFPSMTLNTGRRKMFEQSKQRWLALYACFPRKTATGTAMWIEWDVKSCLMRHLVEAEIKADLEKYQKMLQEHEEVRTYFLVKNVSPKLDESATKLLKELMDADGAVARAGVDAANKALKELGNPVRIVGYRRFSQRHLTSEYGLEKRLDPGEFFRHDKDKPALVTFQKEGQRPPAETNPHRGKGLYSFVSTRLQMPLIEECRRNLQTPDFVKLPDNGEIDDGLGGTYLRSEIWGSPLPFLVETYRPSRSEDKK